MLLRHTRACSFAFLQNDCPSGTADVLARELYVCMQLCGETVLVLAHSHEVWKPLVNLAVMQVEQLHLQLPALCACHDIPVLDPTYTSYCHPDCQFYNNEERFSMMLKGLLETWGIIEP